MNRCLLRRFCFGVLRIPVVAKLEAAPLDDEELTEEDRRAISESRKEPGIAWSEVEAELNAG